MKFLIASLSIALFLALLYLVIRYAVRNGIIASKKYDENDDH